MTPAAFAARTDLLHNLPSQATFPLSSSSTLLYSLESIKRDITWVGSVGATGKGCFEMVHVRVR
jgi:hypothetical protein